MPFAGYKDFDDCVNRNRNKKDPSAYCASIMRQVEEGRKKEEKKGIEITSDEIFKGIIPVTKAYVEKDANGADRKYIEVTVSGIKMDRDGERMSKAAIKSLINKYNSGKVPAFSNHGLDKNGNRVYDWKDIIGKWVAGEEVGDNLKATMQLNEANPDAKLLWAYANEQDMPIGFSIGGKVLNKHEEVEE